MRVFHFIILLSLILSAAPSRAADVTGLIQTIQSYPGHTGLLIRLNVPVKNPDGCFWSAWYIFPDDSSRASFIQSLLLTAYAKRERISVDIAGCYENYPKIGVVTVDAGVAP